MIAALVVLANARAGDIIKTNASLGHVETDMDLRVEVLSLTVSKLSRDPFGNGENPFNDYDLLKERAGTVVLAKITPPAAALRLMAESCRLVGFKDDAGTDLFTNASAGPGNNIFQGNRPFVVLDANEPGYFGVRIRSTRLPARTATRVTAEVLLAFAPTTGEKSESKSDVAIKANEVATVGPVKIKFFAVPAHSHQWTNQPAAKPERVYWRAGFLPDAGIKIVSVAFFSEKADDPILFVKDLDDGGNAVSSKNSSYAGGAERGETKDLFSGRTGYSFTPPEDGKVSIKIRYLPTSALVEKRCLVSTGLSP
jgi:hypothetical protein